MDLDDSDATQAQLTLADVLQELPPDMAKGAMMAKGKGIQSQESKGKTKGRGRGFGGQNPGGKGWQWNPEAGIGFFQRNQGKPYLYHRTNT